ncbi:MAG: oxygenase MpaB family protein [Marmoricola sp.]
MTALVRTENDAVPQAFPSRHREAEARGRRLGKPLRAVTRIFDDMDEDRFDRLGRALTEQDVPAARLVEAMRMRAGEPGRVTHAQFRTALNGGLDAVPDAPPALRTFMELVSSPPAWVDWERVNRGGQVLQRLGSTAGDILQQLSLIGGYRFGGPTDLLVATGGLSGADTLRRIAETQHWTMSIAEPDALRPGHEGWRLTVHVRAMHALVNASYASRPDAWDVDRWGLPINQADQAGTLGLFDATVLVAARALGIPISRRDSDDFMHLWKYTGWLMGVHEDFLTDNERERLVWNLHILLSAPGQTPAGRELVNAILAAQDERDYAPLFGFIRLPAKVRGRYERERMLSLMTVLLGVRSMRELEQPIRPPWALGLRVATNVALYRVYGQLPGGRDRLLRHGRAAQQRVQRSYLVNRPADVAALPD